MSFPKKREPSSRLLPQEPLQQYQEPAETVPPPEVSSPLAEPDFESLYANAAEQYPNKVCKGNEDHHITPKYLGGDPNGPTISIPAPYHQQITNYFRSEAPYGKEPPSPIKLQNIKNRVYQQYPLPDVSQ